MPRVKDTLCAPTLYCKTCARHISPRPSNNPLVYCSAACKKHKPAPFDRQIEEIFITELQKSTFVLCSQIEALAYPTAEAPEEVREEGTFVGNDELAGKGMERAHRKERVKQAGRRVVVFGKDYECKSPNGKTLDPSFAHGDWGVGRV